MADYPTIDFNMLLDNLKRDAEYVSNTWNHFDLHRKAGAMLLAIGIVYALLGDSVKIGVVLGVVGASLVMIKTNEDKVDTDDPAS